MQKYADRKGGFTASPDGFDRSDQFTLAGQIDEWFEWLAERNYSKRTVDKHAWSLRSFQRAVHRQLGAVSARDALRIGVVPTEVIVYQLGI